MGMPEESEPTEYRKGVIMKKHRIISIALSVIGIKDIFFGFIRRVVTAEWTTFYAVF